MDATYSKLYYVASKKQKIAGFLAILFAFVTMTMTASWANNSNTDDGYLGGLNWSSLVFNWHPVLMVAGLVFCLVCSIMSYRLFPGSKFVIKLLHASFHTAAIICIIIGLSAVITAHNYTDKNSAGTYYPNLYSIHSLLGISAVILYFLNFVMGIFFFLLPGVAENIKKNFKPNHIFLGLFILFAVVFAVETGLMKLTKNCTYEVNEADWNPAENYHKLSSGCRLANGIGIMVLVTVFLSSYALFGPGDAPHGGDSNNSTKKYGSTAVIETGSSSGVNHSIEILSTTENSIFTKLQG